MAKFESFFWPQGFWDKTLLISCAIALIVFSTINLLEFEKGGHAAPLLAVPGVIAYFFVIGLTARYVALGSVRFFVEAKCCMFGQRLANIMLAFIYLIAGLLGSFLTLFILWRGYYEAMFWKGFRPLFEDYTSYDYGLWVLAISYFLLCIFYKLKRTE